MLTGDDDPDTMMRALVAGADGYLLKRVGDLAPKVTEMLERSSGSAGPGSPIDAAAFGWFLLSAGLSAGTVEALRAYAEVGFPESKRLADRLGMTEAATSKLLCRAEEKLGLESRGQLIRLLTVLSGYGARDRRDAG
jgi:DNA-binding response OmpR family regulator